MTQMGAGLEKKMAKFDMGVGGQKMPFFWVTYNFNGPLKVDLK